MKTLPHVTVQGVRQHLPMKTLLHVTVPRAVRLPKTTLLHVTVHRVRETGEHGGETGELGEKRGEHGRETGEHGGERGDEAEKILSKSQGSLPHCNPAYDALEIQLAESNLLIDCNRADANCFFRAISKCMYGTEGEHKLL